MKYNDYLTDTKDLSEFLLGKRVKGVKLIETFSPKEKTIIGDWSSESNLPVPVRGDGIGNKSGVYFILTEDEEVLYIGKATKGNLHERIWDHLRTPEKLEDGTMIFPKTRFIQDGCEPSLSELVKEGRVKIGIIEVEPNELTSLVEVYLQSINLPPLCKQIG